jgi:ABC-2 type transport system permease protein
MRLLHLTIKDLSQILRDRRSLIFLVAMPIFFTIFMGFAYRSSSTPTVTRLVLGWINADPQGMAANQLLDSLGILSDLRLEKIDPDDLDNSIEKVRKGELAGILSIPPNFSSAAMSGGNPQVELYTDELTTSGQAVFQLVRGPITRVMGAVEIANLSTKYLITQNILLFGSDTTNEVKTAFDLASQTWNRFAKEGIQVVVEKGAQQVEGLPFGGNPYNQTSPGILTMFALFGLVSSANILVQERKTHTLHRMMTTSMSAAEIIAGHLLANFTICFGSTLILLIFGQLVLGVDYIRQPIAILVISLALGLWVAAVGLTISVFAENDSQVVVYSLITMFIFSALGGTWFPLDVSGAVFAAVGQLTPTAWVMTGYQNILMRGLDLSSAWLPVGILLAYAAAFFLIAVWRFSRRDLA